MCHVFNNLFHSVGLRHLYISKFIPLMGKLRIEELHVASYHQIHAARFSS